MGKNNVISFDSKRNNSKKSKPNNKSDINQQAKEILERSSMIPLGTIFLDLYMDEDHTGMSMYPSYQLLADMDDDLVDQIGDMLKSNFSDCIDKLLQRFKENRKN